jgi:L-asparaginase II
MPTPALRIEATRGCLPDSEHRVIAAVVRADGSLLASSGDPGYSTWWRSAAKPFQALPLVQDGVTDRFHLTDAELALACASHSSEPRHLEVVSGLMTRLGITDAMLACGPHQPLSPEVAREVARQQTPLTARWSNCSGKHAGMIALALHHGWPVSGYQEEAHPVQQRVFAEVSRWTGLDPADMARAPDGCTAVCFGLPVRAMALSYARLGASADSAARRIVAAMLGHPFLMAGTDRLCTDLMVAWPAQVIAKVGALGVYCAAIPALQLGIALKVEDGDTRASGVALLAILREVLAQGGGVPSRPGPDWEALAKYAAPTIRNSRGSVTGSVRAVGGLRFSGP